MAEEVTLTDGFAQLLEKVMAGKPYATATMLAPGMLVRVAGKGPHPQGPEDLRRIMVEVSLCPPGL